MTEAALEVPERYKDRKKAQFDRLTETAKNYILKKQICMLGSRVKVPHKSVTVRVRYQDRS